MLEHEIIAHFVTSAGTAVRSLRLPAQHNPSPSTVTPQGLEIIAQVYPEGGTSDIPKHKASPDVVTPHSPDDDTEIIAHFVLEDLVATRLLVWLFAHNKVPLSSTPHIFSRRIDTIFHLYCCWFDTVNQLGTHVSPVVALKQLSSKDSVTPQFGHESSEYFQPYTPVYMPAVATYMGAAEGALDGSELGMALGEALGSLDGALDGWELGLAFGILLGILLG